jgi:hypothetical protein
MAARGPHRLDTGERTMSARNCGSAALRKPVLHAAVAEDPRLDPASPPD